MDEGTIKQIEDIGFKKCTFDNMCETCEKPELGSFAREIWSEYDDDWYWMCGKCILKDIEKYYWKTNMQLLRHFDEKEKTVMPF